MYDIFVVQGMIVFSHREHQDLCAVGSAQTVQVTQPGTGQASDADRLIWTPLIKARVTEMRAHDSHVAPHRAYKVPHVYLSFILVKKL